MKFKGEENQPDGRMHLEFRDKIHPDLRAFLLDFDAWSVAEKMPEPTITMLGRTIDEETSIYLGYWAGLLHRYKAKEKLTHREEMVAIEKSKHTPSELLAQAQGMFSWHFCWCAVDLRDRFYSEAELPRAIEWMRDRCPTPMWLVLEHDITAPHIHVQRADFTWRKQFDPRNKKEVAP